MSGAAEAVLPLSLAEAKAYLRVETPAEDALIAGLIRAAAGLCEAFTGQLLVARELSEMVAADGAWRRLGAAPVVSVTSVESMGGGALAEGLWAASVEAGGDGWVKVDPAAGAAVSVRYRAGMADDWNGVPEPLRQGMARLVAHLHACRDGDGAPPAAVAALWRPWRRMRLG